MLDLFFDLEVETLIARGTVLPASRSRSCRCRSRLRSTRARRTDEPDTVDRIIDDARRPLAAAIGVPADRVKVVFRIEDR